MPINISQFPTSPNMANNNLLFTVSSTSASAAQFQYVLDVSLSGSASTLQTIKQQPNPSGFGVFDVGQIVSNFLDSDDSWRASPFVTSSEVGKRFQVKFGEQYASSISGAAILYTGVAAVTGSPAVTASSFGYFVANGLVEPYDKINWNFPSASYFTGSAVSQVQTFSKQHALTNAPLTQYINDLEYATLSFFNGSFTNSTTAAQDIFVVNVKVFDSSDTEIDDFDLLNVVSNGGGPRTVGSQLWSAVGGNQSAATQLITVGVGPQNLSDDGNALPSDWAYLIVNAFGQEAASTVNLSGSYAEFRYEKQLAQCGYNGVRFAWKNEFGVWDYYTFTLQNDITTSIEREQFTQTYVDYSTSNPTVAYNKNRRGNKQFYNALTQKQRINSNWVDQEEADWLKELFFSANVFQQVGFDFLPVVITSAELVQKTNPRTQQNFQYVVEFEPANQPNPRL